MTNNKLNSDQDLKKWLNMCIRIRLDLHSAMEHCRQKRIGMSRTAWILEAIQEKIKREKNER